MLNFTAVVHPNLPWRWTATLAIITKPKPTLAIMPELRLRRALLMNSPYFVVPLSYNVLPAAFGRVIYERAKGATSYGHCRIP